MFRALICPSPGVCDYIGELPHWLFRSWFAVCWSLGVDTTLAEPRLLMVCDAHHKQAHSQQHTLTQHDMWPQYPVTARKLINECF